MIDPNPNLPVSGVRSDDPLDDPNYDLMNWIMSLDFLPEPLAIRRHEFIKWAAAVGFQNIEMRHLGEHGDWEFRCNRGTNPQCMTTAVAERWLGYCASGCGCQFAPGQFITIVDGDSIAARFRLEPSEQEAA